jgi:hypothetical protein
MSPSPEARATRAGASAVLIALLLAGCGGAAPEAQEAPRPTAFAGALASRTISLPTDEAQFPEPAAALLNRNCLSCHSTTMVLYQPRLTEAQWQATVAKMRDAYKAPIAEGDVAGIVRELMALNAGGGAGH